MTDMGSRSVFEDGIIRVWRDDRLSQEKFTNIVAEARGMHGVDFESLRAFFIPNDDYLLSFFDESIKNDEYGVYDYNGFCHWNNCLVFPIYNVAGVIRSFVGFNPFNYLRAHEENDWSLNYYIYADGKHFRKSAYMFGMQNSYTDAMDSGMVFVTDGVFDTISLSIAGFNSLALLGSAVTPEIIMLLRFVQHVLAVVDNDEAGYKLARRLSSVHSNVTVVHQKCTKDIDDLLKSNKRNAAISELRNACSSYSSEYTLNV